MSAGILVIGSIIGSLFGTLMFLPGLAMIFGGLKIKEQRFNARAQGTCPGTPRCVRSAGCMRLYGR